MRGQLQQMREEEEQMKEQKEQLREEKDQLYSELASVTREGLHLTAQVRGLDKQVQKQHTHVAFQDKVMLSSLTPSWSLPCWVLSSSPSVVRLAAIITHYLQ